MKHSIKLSTYIYALVLYAVLFVCASAQAETMVETFEVKLGGKLIVQTDLGSIKVDTHEQSNIELTVEIQNQQQNQFSYHHKLIDGNLTIIGELEDNRRWSNNLKVNFNLVIPKHYQVELTTSGGSLTIQDLVGNLDASTSGGSIRVGNITGDVNLNTSGGAISTQAIKGNLNAYTSGGSINVTIAEQLTDNAKLSTSGGSITAYLIADAKLDIYASTSGGRVKSDFDIDGRVKKMSVRGSINGGGPKLTLKTSGGSIKIKEM